MSDLPPAPATAGIEPGSAPSPGFGPFLTLAFLGLYFLLCIGLHIPFQLWTRISQGAEADLAPWLTASLNELAFLGAAAVGLRNLGAGWIRSLGWPPPAFWRVGSLLAAGWLGALALEIRTLEWAIARWPRLLPPLPDCSIAYALVPSVLLAPLAEEAFFRGVLCEGLARRYGSATGIMGSAALFALCHWHWALWPGCLVFGILMGLAQRQAGSILPCVILHAANNALAWMAAAS